MDCYPSYLVTFTINIPQILAYIYTIHGSYGLYFYIMMVTIFYMLVSPIESTWQVWERPLGQLGPSAGAGLPKWHGPILCLHATKWQLWWGEWSKFDKKLATPVFGLTQFGLSDYQVCILRFAFLPQNFKGVCLWMRSHITPPAKVVSI